MLNELDYKLGRFNLQQFWDLKENFVSLERKAKLGDILPFSWADIFSVVNAIKASYYLSNLNHFNNSLDWFKLNTPNSNHHSNCFNLFYKHLKI